MSRPLASLHREFLGFFVFLLAAGILLAALSLSVLLPVLQSPRETAGFLVVLVVADVAVVGFFGSFILRRRLVAPIRRMEDDVARIADGDVLHRLGPMPADELERIRVGINAMADRLVRDREALAENVASLDRTNQELLAARDQVLQAARLASAGTLAAGIAHEIGNPLGAILGYLDVAVRRLEKGTLDRELLNAVRDEARRIDQIIRTLLDYARPEPGKEEPEPVAVAPILERVRELLSHQGKLSRVELSWQVPQELPRILVRPRALEQVMVNLLLNAVDATADERPPRLAVDAWVEEGRHASMPARREGDPPGVDYAHRRRVGRASPVTDPVRSAQAVVVIRVRDNGPGVTEELRSRIFDPFFTTKDPGSGTGLGLAISARLVEGMGGRLELPEAQGRGATFALRIPAFRSGRETK